MFANTQKQYNTFKSSLNFKEDTKRITPEFLELKMQSF